MQLYCTTKPLEWWGGPLGAGPSKQLPCPREGQQHSAQSSAALSSYSSESQEFIWIKLKVRRIWLPSLQLSNLIHERDSHALAEKDKQDASTRVTRMKEIVLNSSLPVLRSPPPHIPLSRTSAQLCVNESYGSNTLNTEARRLLIPNQMLNQANTDGARAQSPRRAIMMCLSVCVTQRLPFAASRFFFIQKHERKRLMGNIQLRLEG